MKLDDATGDEGSGGIIKCTASGDPIPKIKWQKQGNSQDFTDGTQTVRFYVISYFIYTMYISSDCSLVALVTISHLYMTSVLIHS